MKWPPFALNIPISRLVKWLIITVLIKLCLLVVLTLDIEVPGLSSQQTLETANLEAPMPQPSLVAEAMAAEGDQNASEEPLIQDDQNSEPFSMQRENLLRKQEELNRKEQALMALEQEVDDKLVRLQELEAKLNRLLEQANELRDEKMKHLIDVYTNMKAKQAAQVIETLDESIAVKILAGMRGRQAGEILTYVAPEKAASLSEALTKMQAAF